MKFTSKIIFNKKIILIIGIAIFLSFSSIFLYFYFLAFKSNLKIKNKDTVYLKIPTGSNFNTLIDIIKQEDLLININSFKKLAEKKNLPNHIYPGRYKLDGKMGNNKLINLLRSGNQEPLNVLFNSVRTKEKLAQLISQQLEVDSLELLNYLNNQEYLSNFNFSTETILAMFVPNTYEFFWNTNADGFIKRMYKEYTRFWSEYRKNKAIELKLTPLEVSILASIVDEEALIDQEMPKIAGVYINRLRKEYKLGADPTIKFALGNLKKKRILLKDLEIESPYNTYKYYGLPPGPICIPSIAAIDAVLNYEKHHYLYFCAKEDFSGYHNFAKTLKEHNRNAKLYQDALNKNKVYK